MRLNRFHQYSRAKILPESGFVLHGKNLALLILQRAICQLFSGLKYV